MKIMDDFRYKWKPSCIYHKIDTFRGDQSKKDTGKSMKNALYRGMAKGTSWAEATSNSEKSSP